MNDEKIIQDEREKTVVQSSNHEEELAAYKAELKKQADEIKALRESLEKSQNNTPTVAATQPKNNSEFEELKLLLESDQWPPAVDPALICDITSDQDKQDRAEGIIDLIIDTYLENLSFLDFGCGEGHVINHSRKQNPKKAVGYDISISEKWTTWEKADNLLFTEKWEEIKNNGPYNIILMYDVLDHIEQSEEELIETMKQIKAVLAPGGKIYFRGHPWCSRHATHLYHKLNKAYAHLVFTDEELASMNYTQQKVRKYIHPIASYNTVFHKAGLNTHRKEQITRERVERFFTDTPNIAKKIKEHWLQSHDNKLKSGKNFPVSQCEMQFVDYILN